MFKQNLYDLVMNLVYAICEVHGPFPQFRHLHTLHLQDRVQPATRAKHLNTDISFFLRDLLTYMVPSCHSYLAITLTYCQDRGFVFSLILDVVRCVRPNTVVCCASSVLQDVPPDAQAGVRDEGGRPCHVPSRVSSRPSVCQYTLSSHDTALQIICSHEHFVALNLPLLRAPSETILTLEPALTQAHFLIALLLFDLRSHAKKYVAMLHDEAIAHL